MPFEFGMALVESALEAKTACDLGTDFGFGVVGGTPEGLAEANFTACWVGIVPEGIDLSACPVAFAVHNLRPALLRVAAEDG